MFSVKVGTSNFDGTGSSKNLKDADIVLHKPETGAMGDDFLAYENNTTVVASADYWNAPQAKELQVNAENTNVISTDFVDIDINLEGSHKGVNVEVINSKRGSIDTGSGDDTIFVQVETNNAGWSNQFDVDSGKGDDTIIFTDGSNSQFTKVSIEAGKGDDTIDISMLSANTDDANERFIDGGKGDDTIIGSEGNDEIYGGKGDDYISAGGGDDIIVGGKGDDTINAGAGNDTVEFDKADKVINGGDGFDALIVTGGRQNVTGAENFEAIIGSEGVFDAVTVEMQDGLIIALGDGSDQVKFTQKINFNESNAGLTSEQLEFIDANNIDMESLHAYETEGGDVVWSDVDLLA